MATYFQLLAVTLAMFASKASADIDMAAIDDACLADGSDSEECALSLRQLRGERKTVEVSQHNSSGNAAAGFCCYSGVTQGKTCSTCMPTAMAVDGTYCATEASCGGCGGTWCTAHCVYSGENPNDICGTAYDTAVAASSSGCGASKKACTGCKGHWCGVDATPAPSAESADATSSNGSAGNATTAPVPAPSPVTSEPGFCCYEGTTTDTCGSCLPTAQAKEDSYCAQKNTCGGCDGTWCAARCVYAGSDSADICGTAYDDAVAAPTSSCAHSERLCTGCKGSWCPVSNFNGTATPIVRPTAAPEPPDAKEDDDSDAEDDDAPGLPGDFALPK